MIRTSLLALAVLLASTASAGQPKNPKSQSVTSPGIEITEAETGDAALTVCQCVHDQVTNVRRLREGALWEVAKSLLAAVDLPNACADSKCNSTQAPCNSHKLTIGASITKGPSGPVIQTTCEHATQVIDARRECSRSLSKILRQTCGRPGAVASLIAEHAFSDESPVWSVRAIQVKEAATETSSASTADVDVPSEDSGFALDVLDLVANAVLDAADDAVAALFQDSSSTTCGCDPKFRDAMTRALQGPEGGIQPQVIRFVTEDGIERIGIDFDFDIPGEECVNESGLLPLPNFPYPLTNVEVRSTGQMFRLGPQVMKMIGGLPCDANSCPPSRVPATAQYFPRDVQYFPETQGGYYTPLTSQTSSECPAGIAVCESGNRPSPSAASHGIPEGLRLLVIPLELPPGMNDHLGPQQRIDVLLTRPRQVAEMYEATSPTEGSRTRMVAENIEVVAVHHHDGRSALSVLVRPEQALQLVEAEHEGHLCLTLRNPREQTARSSHRPASSTCQSTTPAQVTWEALPASNRKVAQSSRRPTAGRQRYVIRLAQTDDSENPQWITICNCEIDGACPAEAAWTKESSATCTACRSAKSQAPCCDDCPNCQDCSQCQGCPNCSACPQCGQGRLKAIQAHRAGRPLPSNLRPGRRVLATTGPQGVVVFTTDDGRDCLHDFDRNACELVAPCESCEGASILNKVPYISRLFKNTGRVGPMTVQALPNGVIVLNGSATVCNGVECADDGQCCNENGCDDKGCPDSCPTCPSSKSPSVRRSGNSPYQCRMHNSNHGFTGPNSCEQDRSPVHEAVEHLAIAAERLQSAGRHRHAARIRVEATQLQIDQLDETRERLVEHQSELRQQADDGRTAPAPLPRRSEQPASSSRRPERTQRSSPDAASAPQVIQGVDFRVTTTGTRNRHTAADECRNGTHPIVVARLGEMLEQMCNTASNSPMLSDVQRSCTAVLSDPKRRLELIETAANCLRELQADEHELVVVTRHRDDIVAEIRRNGVAMTNSDVVDLVSRNVSEEVIVRMIDTCEPRFTTDPEHLLKLRRRSVSDSLIHAMLNAGRQTRKNPDPLSSQAAREIERSLGVR